MPVVEVLAIVDGLISVADKLLDKLPSYDQRKKEEYMELKKTYEVYKESPIEHRMNSYLWNLKKELVGHLDAMVGAI